MGTRELQEAMEKQIAERDATITGLREELAKAKKFKLDTADYYDKYADEHANDACEWLLRRLAAELRAL
jgi:hypothetical protein